MKSLAFNLGLHVCIELNNGLDISENVADFMAKQMMYLFSTAFIPAVGPT